MSTLLKGHKVKRIVVKVGTSTLTHGTGLLNLRRIENLAKILSDIKNSGVDVVLVTSGAIGVGMSKLGMTVRPSEVRYKQAAASVGQCELMHIYDKFFLDFGQTIGQILITRDDVATPERRKCVEDTLETLIETGAIPIVNENDSTGIDEILFGDNDSLSAQVAVLSHADLLVLFSDIDGLYDKDPHKYDDAKLIPIVDELDNMNCDIGGAGSNRGTGGMISKINAAKEANSHGIDMIITNGENINVLYDILEGKPTGTVFMCK